ncbi:uncharacterized protein LOC113944574 [Corapipo altera]|uniref:uncharacterized protein LOC113944574 n=1 Tax=Corapipo altera TaxID=415028 RepID=UPI000FD67644|nr:uncharacterized protein LOC113944574 [Corapipo altera]
MKGSHEEQARRPRTLRSRRRHRAHISYAYFSEHLFDNDLYLLPEADGQPVHFLVKKNHFRILNPPIPPFSMLLVFINLSPTYKAEQTIVDCRYFCPLCPQSRKKVGMLKVLQDCRNFPCPTVSEGLNRIIPVSLPASGLSASLPFKSVDDTQVIFSSNPDHVNPENYLIGHYLLLWRWVLLGRSPKAHRVRQVERGESGRTAGLRHGTVSKVHHRGLCFP